MAIGDKLIKRLGGVTEAELSAIRVRAYESGYNDGEDEPNSGTLARFGYKTLRDSATRNSAIDPDQAFNIAWALWQSNPVARRAIAIKRDYIIGRGVTPQADNEDVKELVDAYFANNKLDDRLDDFTAQLFALGTQCLTVNVRESDGRIMLGYIDPQHIETVVTHPDNGMDIVAVIVKEGSGQGKRAYRLIRKAEEGEQAGRWLLPTQGTIDDWETAMLRGHEIGEYAGACHYRTVNAVSNQPRGVSDLLPVADWCDQLDATLFGLAEREQMAGYFSFDVKIEGADKDQVRARAIELRSSPPKKGSVNVHNEKETWSLHAPALNQAGSIETVKELLAFILGGLGIPVHWYGRGDETNRATAQAQGDPTWRSLEHDQGIIKGLVVEMLECARDQAIIAGKLSVTEEDEGLDVQMPEMTAKDTVSTTAALSALSAALAAAEQNKWMTHKQAIELWARQVGEMGIEIDTEEVEELEDGEDMSKQWPVVNTPVTVPDDQPVGA